MDANNKNIDVATMAAAAVSVSAAQKEALAAHRNTATNNNNNDDNPVNSGNNVDESVLDPELNQQMDDMDQMDRIEDDVVDMASSHGDKNNEDDDENINIANTDTVNDNEEESNGAKIKNANYIANMSAIVNASQMQSQMQNVGENKQEEQPLPSSRPTSTSSSAQHLKMNQHKVTKPAVMDSTSNVVAVAQLLKDDTITNEVQSEKRAQQNRAAQRAFRQRRKERIQSLEDTERKYNEALAKIELLTERNKELERQLSGME